MAREELLSNIEKLHTTPMGSTRIKENLGLNVADIVGFCKNKISDKRCEISKKGKNFYCDIDDMVITVNSFSYTIITAHAKRNRSFVREK